MLAWAGLEITACNLIARGIVNDHRGQARSHRVCGVPEVGVRLENTAYTLNARDIVNDHRGQARSHKGCPLKDQKIAAYGSPHITVRH